MKACIFDLDGTLTDTLESLTYSVGETLKEMGLPEITEEECRSFVGNGARVLKRREKRILQGLTKGWRDTDAYLTPTVHIM